MKFDFLGVKKTFDSARNEVATLRDRLQSVRASMARIRQHPVAKAEIRDAFVRWLDEARTAVVADTAARAAEISNSSAGNSTAPILAHRALQVDERGRAVIDSQLLVALLGAQLLELIDTAVADPSIPTGITSAARTAELERLTNDAKAIEQQIAQLEEQAAEAGLEL